MNNDLFFPTHRKPYLQLHSRLNYITSSSPVQHRVESLDTFGNFFKFQSAEIVLKAEQYTIFPAEIPTITLKVAD